MTALPGLSTFANRERRKKPVVTYGRPTRNPAFSKSTSNPFYEHSKDGTSPSKLKRPAVNAVKKSEKIDDEFDIPLSDEEPVSAPPKTKTPLQISVDRPAVTSDRDEPDSISPRKRKRSSPRTVQPSTVSITANTHKTQRTKTESAKDANTAIQPRRSRRQAAFNPPTTPEIDRNTTRAPKITPLVDATVCPLSPKAVSPDTSAGPILSPSTTPKQKRLWHELLLSDPPAPDTFSSISSPPHMPVTHVSAQSFTRSERPLEAENSGLRKTRIVDRLKTSTTTAQESDEDVDDDLNDPKQEAALKVVDKSTDSKNATSQETTEYSQARSLLQAQQSSTSQRVTYARSRTYLEDSLEDMIFGDLPMTMVERPTAALRRTGAPTTTKNKPKIKPDDDSDEGLSQCIRSIHELRAAGHKNRFLDDATRLVDDIKNPKPSSKSQRRSALMELAGTLADKRFASRFAEYGFDSSIVAQLQCGGMDVIADILLCVIIARMANSSVSLLQGGALDFLGRHLKEIKDTSQIARDRRSNMSKVAQSDFIEFMESVRKSEVWQNSLPESLSPRLVALMSVNSLVTTHRRNKHSGAILSPAITSTLVDLATEKNLASENASQVTKNLALSALEAATTLDVASAASDAWSTESLSRIAADLPNLLEMPKSSQVLALQLCVSVTNDNEGNCSVFCDNKTMHLLLSRIIAGFQHLYNGSEGTDVACDRDLLMLALGLVINLANLSEVARENAFRAKDDGFNALVGFFLEGRKRVANVQSEEDLEEMENNIPYGWLAVLLGTMCLDGNVRRQVRTQLPNNNDAILVEAVEQFAALHHQVDSQTMDEENEMSAAYARFTRKLSALVGRLRDGK